MSDLPFDFEIPITFFEKADAEPGKQRRIGGVITTESPDRQGEVILQRSLDFSPFLTYGWYNDNHDRSATGILGYPEAVQFYGKGAVLPNGETMKSDGHWAEGYLLETKKADQIWELGKALQKTNRRLGFSVEGSIQKRTGPLRKCIAKATVKNVAITHVPVQADSRLELLAKSLMAVERSEPNAMQKSLGYGTDTPTGDKPMGPKTGDEAGKVLARQSLESKQRKLFEEDEDEKKKKSMKKSLSDDEAILWLRSQRPQLSLGTCERIVTLTKALKRQGRL